MPAFMRVRPQTPGGALGAMPKLPASAPFRARTRAGGIRQPSETQQERVKKRLDGSLVELTQVRTRKGGNLA